MRSYTLVRNVPIEVHLSTNVGIILMLCALAGCGKATNPNPPSAQNQAIDSCSSVGGKYAVFNGPLPCGLVGSYCITVNEANVYANSKAIDPASCEYKAFLNIYTH